MTDSDNFIRAIFVIIDGFIVLKSAGRRTRAEKKSFVKG
jgi:hypothetical protein